MKIGKILELEVVGYNALNVNGLKAKGKEEYGRKENNPYL